MTAAEMLLIVHPDDRETIRNALDAAVREQKPYDIQHRIVRQESGEVRFVHTRGDLAADESGRFSRLVGACQDITERKRSEEEREVFGRLATRLAASVSAEHIVEVVREESDHLLGWDAYFFVVRNKSDDDYKTLSFIDTVNGVKQAFPGQPWPLFRESPRVQRIINRESLLFNRPTDNSDPAFTTFGNTTCLSASFMYVPVCSGKKVIGVLSAQSYTPNRYNEGHLRVLQRIADMVAPALERAYAEDALRESEQKYRMLTEQLPDLVWQKDRHGTYVSCNKQYAKAVGLTIETIAGHRDEDFYPPELAAKYQADDDRVMTTGQTVDIEEPGQHRTNPRWFSTRKVPVQDETGRCIGTIGIARDITDRKQVEEELARYHDRLEELVKQRTRELEESQDKLRRSERLASLGTLAAGIGHEINNPVGGILLAAQTAIASGGLTDVVAGRLEEIIKNAQRCKDIVQNMRRFARAERTEKTSGDLNSVLRRAAELVREALAGKGCTVQLDLSNSLPNLVMNQTGIEQVIINLLTNAIEAGTRHVTLRTESAGDQVRLAVQDDGQGMSQEQTVHLFDPFYTTRYSRGGTGLGLSIAHGIIRDHNGTIDVLGEPGQGALFTITLPLTVSKRDQGAAHGQGPDR